MRVLAELIDLGMQLARATAAKALADLAEPEAPEEAAPEFEPPAEPKPEAAQSATPRRTGPRSPGATSGKPPDPVTAFLRLATAVCHCIALEAQLGAGPATKSGLVSPALRADPRREPLIKAFREVTAQTQDKSAIRYEFTRRLDEELTADPEQLLGFPEIFYPLCAALGIELDARKLSDQIIGMDPWDYENDPYCMDPPNPPRHAPALNQAASGGLLFATHHLNAPHQKPPEKTHYAHIRPRAPAARSVCASNLPFSGSIYLKLTGLSHSPQRNRFPSPANPGRPAKETFPCPTFSRPSARP